MRHPLTFQLFVKQVEVSNYLFIQKTFYSETHSPVANISERNGHIIPIHHFPNFLWLTPWFAPLGAFDADRICLGLERGRYKMGAANC